MTLSGGGRSAADFGKAVGNNGFPPAFAGVGRRYQSTPSSSGLA